MIGQRADALLVQPFGGVLDLGARQAIDDAALALVARQEPQQLLARLVALDDRVGDVGAVEAGREDLGRPQAELVDDVFARMRIGRRRQRDARHAGIELGELAELAIFRAEIVAPLADAMRLVDGEERDRRIADHLAEARRRRGARARHRADRARRRQIARRTSRNSSRDSDELSAAAADAELLQRLHLVAHQRDQRRDDDADAVAAERRDLVAERLAGAGREQHDGIAAGRHMFDDRLLLAAERGIAVDRLQDRERMSLIRCVREQFLRNRRTAIGSGRLMHRICSCCRGTMVRPAAGCKCH